MSVLVVDDAKTMARITRVLLGQIGFRSIDEAHDGFDALVKMRSRKYGLVISDCYMEQMSGMDLLKQIRTDKTLMNTPFIMVTTEAKVENVVAAKRAGVDGYIVRPFSAETLKAKIEAVLAFDPERRHLV
jgi:two-component system chemotaxis response regulator CheY